MGNVFVGSRRDGRLSYLDLLHGKEKEEKEMSVQMIAKIGPGDKEGATKTFSELWEMLAAMVEDLADGNVMISIEVVE